MQTEVNDIVVRILTVLMNVLHIIAVLALIIFNVQYYKNFSELMETSDLIISQVLMSIGSVVVYVLFVGVISLWISINRNLQRLVYLQGGQLKASIDCNDNKPAPQVTVSAPQVTQKDPNLHPYEDGYHDN